ncbi:hypothetical protein SAMN06265222_12188 [Neorhodopirellula lusitana]|uniref:DUF6798 domain-containing protein n=1 Tax=Neorhodopirellula lusitana TaxID=445327 RepID=A0ABY1QNY6_9BACT|nr:DUF6798 domain-containing protein [Neorhodopirellula lusitana]SMP76620.1 hypothetical protein SAMN06265222_12188 [Neorhodopirellula lusitana]
MTATACSSNTVSAESAIPGQWWHHPGIIFLATVALFFVYAGDAPPGVNEAHYLVKAKNFWDASWCHEDLFVRSGKAHAFFYWVFGWPTQFVSLTTTAWIGRLVAWSMIACGLVRLTASLRIPLAYTLVIATVWLAGIQHGNLAGEWVIGGIEAKVPAYGLVLMGIVELIHRRWNRVWLYFGLASAFHVLTGGWSVVAGAIAFVLLEKSPWKQPSNARFFTPGLFGGGAISLLGLIPALAMSSGVSSAESISAAKTYAYFRISHHLLPSAFHFDWYVRHAVLTLTAATLLIALIRNGRPQNSNPILALTAFAFGAVSIALLGLLVGILPAVSPDWGARLLRFYWFRLADAVTPLALACAVACWLQAGTEAVAMKPRFSLVWIARGITVVAVILVGQTTWINVSGGVPISLSNRLLGLHSKADYGSQRRTVSDWIKVCRFVRANTDEDAVLLTPRHQQTFKWYAHRAEVVNWKDIPQDAPSLREWARRFVEIFPTELSTMRVTIRYDKLRHFRERYGVDWMIVDRRVVGPHLPLVQVYPLDNEHNHTYAVYRLPSSLIAIPTDRDPR